MRVHASSNLKPTMGLAAPHLRAGLHVQSRARVLAYSGVQKQTFPVSVAVPPSPSLDDAAPTEKAKKAPADRSRYEDNPEPATGPTKQIGFKDCIMLQTFGWQSCKQGGWYKTIQSKVSDMKESGFTHVWLPPPSSSPVSEQGYMPGQLYNLTSKYGNQEELTALNTELKAAELLPIADIVINHRCACHQGKDGVWNKFGDDVDHDGLPVDWDRWAITGNDPHFKGTGNPDTGEDYGPAPDLDHANPELRQGLKNWLQFLHKVVGFSGWRLDFVKGYAAEYVKEYVEASVGLGSVNVGEFWTDLKWNGSDLDYNQDDARQTLCDWIDANDRSSAAFDFPTKGILQEAAKNCQFYRLIDPEGKPPGLIGWWPTKAVTFIDNHDTGSTQQHWPFPGDMVGMGYAYILTHPGIPCVFWEHLFDWGDDMRDTINTLIAVRKRNGIQANAHIDILCAEADLYVARINSRVVVKLGPRIDMGPHLPNKEEGWKKCASGHDFCVWEMTE